MFNAFLKYLNYDIWKYFWKRIEQYYWPMRSMRYWNKPLAKWYVNFKICKRLCISTFLQMNVKPACTHPHCSLFKWHWQMIIAVASLLTKCNDRSTFLYQNFKRHHVEKQPSHGRIYFLTIIYQSLILSPASNTLLYFRFLKYWNFKRATIIA